MRIPRALAYSSSLLLLGFLPYVAAHGAEHGGHGMNMDATTPTAIEAAAAAIAATHTPSPGYWYHNEHQGWLYTHILSMTIAWVVILPISKTSPLTPQLE